MTKRSSYFIRLLGLAAFLLVLHTTDARNYYLANTGNDRANGRKPQTAWQTLSRLQQVRLRPGDTVFFKAGHLFRGEVEIHTSGTAAKPIVFTSYGQGPKPVLSGAQKLENWTHQGRNIYTTTFSPKAFDLYVDGRWQTPARFPNSGYLDIDGGTDKYLIECAQLTEADGYWNNATIRARTIEWAFETRTVTDYKQGQIWIAPQNRYEIERGFDVRSDDGQTFVYPVKQGYGFYLESPLALDSVGEWSQQEEQIALILPPGQTPGQLNILASIHHLAIHIKPGMKHIKIAGLDFRHYEKGGIWGGYALQDIEIINNSFSNIHQIAIRLDSASLDCRITNNQIQDIQGRGIDANEPARLLIQQNTVSRIGMQPGQGWTGVNGGIGLLISNIERKVNIDTTFAHHNKVADNLVDSCGYAGVRVDGHHNLVEYNLIQNIGYTLNDGAALYCFAQANDVTHHSIFRKNILKNGWGNVQGAVKEEPLLLGIYLDNHSSNIRIEENVVINFKSNGIMVNDASYENTIKDNLIYDCASGLTFLEWKQPGRNFGNVATDNTVICKAPRQLAVRIRNSIGPTLEPGILNNNLYVNLAATNFFFHGTRQIPENSKLHLTLAGWKRFTQQDADSKVISANSKWAADYTPLLLLNDTKETQVFQTVPGSLTLSGKAALPTYKLPPYSARVLLKTKTDAE